LIGSAVSHSNLLRPSLHLKPSCVCGNLMARSVALCSTPTANRQYTSGTFGGLCQQLCVAQSMGATGVCWDNATAQSFFGTLKRELAGPCRWATRADARRDLIRWIEGWFAPDGSAQTSNTRAPRMTKQLPSPWRQRPRHITNLSAQPVSSKATQDPASASNASPS
jgi:hypothetical protein